MDYNVGRIDKSQEHLLAENVRVANTHWTRLRGLIGASRMEFNHGQALWIVPCRGVHTLAMRFPLDLIYLDQSGSAVDLQEQVQPWRFAPLRLRAASVLELPAGSIENSGTKTGDRIEIVAARLAAVSTTSKYVTSVTIAAATGEITVLFNAVVPQVAGKTIVLTPSVGGTQLAGMSAAQLATGGQVDWACASTQAQTAASMTPALPATLGTIDPRYVPTQCK